tara:strand:+ start:301 stop:525 length:225 start_codon:yes stop_codon:yes gene_type:complete
MLTDEEKSILRAWMRRFFEQRKCLFACATPELAQRWCAFLQQHTPEGWAVTVIREREINFYRYYITNLMHTSGE